MSAEDETPFLQARRALRAALDLAGEHKASAALEEALRAAELLKPLASPEAELSRQVRVDSTAAEPVDLAGKVLDLADVLDRETKRPGQTWCPYSRQIVGVEDAAAVCAGCGMEWHGIGAPRAALPHHLPWTLAPAEEAVFMPSEVGGQP